MSEWKESPRHLLHLALIVKLCNRARRTVITRHLMTRRPVVRLDFARIGFFDLTTLEDREALTGGGDFDDFRRCRALRKLARARTTGMELAAAGKPRGIGHRSADGVETLDIRA